MPGHNGTYGRLVSTLSRRDSLELFRDGDEFQSHRSENHEHNDVDREPLESVVGVGRLAKIVLCCVDGHRLGTLSDGADVLIVIDWKE